jgi:hypothetical protein
MAGISASEGLPAKVDRSPVLLSAMGSKTWGHNTHRSCQIETERARPHIGTVNAYCVPGLAITATSVAQAAGVRNPLVLSVIGAMARAAGGGAHTLGEFFKTGVVWGAERGLEVAEGSKIASFLNLVNGLGTSWLVNSVAGKTNWAYTKYGAVDPDPPDDAGFRGPDYSQVTFGGEFGIGFHVQFILDEYGNFYVGGGVNFGFGGDFSIGGGWLSSPFNPSELVLKNAIVGGGVTWEGGYGAGGSLWINPDGGRNIREFGLMSPQVSVSYTQTIFIGNIWTPMNQLLRSVNPFVMAYGGNGNGQ